MNSPLNPTPTARAGEYLIYCHGDRPYFAEVPYFLWGAVDYASSGDAELPTDRAWRELSLVNRANGESLEITPAREAGRRMVLAVRSIDPALALRGAYFLAWRTDGQAATDQDAPLETPPELAARLAGWDVRAATARSVRVRETFGRAELMPFDHADFWPSWKWIGVPAVARTRVGRWIMDSVLRRDPRAVYLCVEWLRRANITLAQIDAIQSALHRLTGLDYARPPDWILWYARKGSTAYPRPDFASWWADVPHE